MGCPVPPQPCKNCLSSCAAALSTALCSSFWVLWYMLWTLTVKGALQISRPLGKSESVGLASPPPTSQKGARSGSPPGEHSIDTKSISQDVNNLFCTCPFSSCNEPCMLLFMFTSFPQLWLHKKPWWPIATFTAPASLLARDSPRDHAKNKASHQPKQARLRQATLMEKEKGRMGLHWGVSDLSEIPTNLWNLFP